MAERLRPPLPAFDTLEEERQHRKERVAAALRVLNKRGLDEGVMGHITVKDPIKPGHFWLNPYGSSFRLLKASDLLLVNHEGEVVEGSGYVNPAGIRLHAKIHAAKPEAIAAVHSHTTYGKVWASLGRLLDPISPDAANFYESHAIYDENSGDKDEDFPAILGSNKALILKNHGILTIGQTVDEATYWFLAFESAVEVQLLAESAGKPTLLSKERAERFSKDRSYSGWFNFQPAYQAIVAEQPDLLL